MKNLKDLKKMWASTKHKKDKSTNERFWDRVYKLNNDECWEWLSYKDKDGYGKFYWREIKQSLTAHRYSWIMHFGKIKSGYEVCHHCDNSSCVNPRHLWLGTHQDNIDDMWRKGRANPLKGENHPCAKITEKNVLEIRNLLQTELTHRQIGNMYNVSKFVVSDIKRNKTWKHVK